MPGNVAGAVGIGVFPQIRASSFTEELRLEQISNAYRDGSSERLALALNPRHFFHVTEGVTMTQWQNLWNFYLAHKGIPFFMYNPRETVPPFSYDVTGSSTIGRYLVVFDGAWSETTSLSRAQVGFSFREVA